MSSKKPTIKRLQRPVHRLLEDVISKTSSVDDVMNSEQVNQTGQSNSKAQVVNVALPIVKVSCEQTIDQQRSSSHDLLRAQKEEPTSAQAVSTATSFALTVPYTLATDVSYALGHFKCPDLICWFIDTTSTCHGK